MFIVVFFQPTLEGRGWVVNPFRNAWYWIFAGLPPALLATILIFMDQQITSVIVNRKENKLLVSITVISHILAIVRFAFRKILKILQYIFCCIEV